MSRRPGIAGAPQRPLLDVRAISKRFDARTVLDGLTFLLRSGESAGITGPKGSGKTVLMDILCGSIRPDGGEVWFEDREITGWSADRVVRAGLAAAFAPPRVAWLLTVRENLEAATLRRRDGAGSERAVAEMLETMRLSPLGRRAAHTLSPGQVRHLEIARALLTGARLLLLDEPFTGLAAEEARALLSTLRRLRREGRSMLIAARRLSAVPGLWDRTTRLEEGRLVDEAVRPDVGDA